MTGQRTSRRWSTTSHQVYSTPRFFSRFLSSFSEQVDRVVLCCPAFDQLPTPFTDIVGFCTFLQQREVGKIVIITGPPGPDNQALPPETAKLLNERGIDIVIRSHPYFNARLYHLEFNKGWFRSFVGSASLTIDGVERNHEIMAEVEGAGLLAPCHQEIRDLMSDNGAMNYPIWARRQATETGTAR